MTHDDLSTPPTDGIQPAWMYEQAKRSGIRYWVISGIWAISLVAIALAFYASVERSYRRIELLEIQARQILGEFQKLDDEVSKIHDLQELHLKVFTLSLQDKQIKGTELRTQERELLALSLDYVRPRASSAEEILILANSFYWEGQEAIATGDYEAGRKSLEESVRYFVQAVEQDTRGGKPVDIETLLRLSVAQRKTGDIAGAIEIGRRALKVAVDGKDKWGEVEARRSMGLSLVVSGAYAEALESLRLSADVAHEEGWEKQDEADLRENIGLAYLRQEEWDLAFENSTDVVALFPKMTWNSLIRAIAADKLGNKDEAKKSYGAWLQLKQASDIWELRPLLGPTLTPYINEGP